MLFVEVVSNPLDESFTQHTGPTDPKRVPVAYEPGVSGCPFSLST